MKKKTVTLMTALFFLLCGACATTSSRTSVGTAASALPLSGTTEALNTSITISIYDSEDKSLLDGCFELIYGYDRMLSRTDKKSEIYTLNEKGSADVSDETLELLKRGIEYSRETGGKFNIAIEPLTSLWNFSSATPKVPADNDIKEALGHLDYSKIVIEGNHVTLPDSASGVDLGAIAKGYIADKVKEYLLGKGVKSALINLGGNVLLVGSKPDGSDFAVGLQDPLGSRNEYKEVVKASDLSVVTSGTYERNFTEGGKTYHHILDPAKGYPYENDLVAVTIISKTSVEGDALSTSCFALGLEEGMKFAESHGVHAVFVTKDGRSHYTKDYPYKSQ